MPITYLALGSNLGDRAGFIRKAIEGLRESGLKILKVATVIETKPVGFLAQGKFLNTVLKASTDYSPQELHLLTQHIEKRLGRMRKMINGPRTIDIDILLYDDIKLVTPRLLIPHPRMLEREFVMKPLKEIEPKIFDYVNY